MKLPAKMMLPANRPAPSRRTAGALPMNLRRGNAVGTDSRHQHSAKKQLRLAPGPQAGLWRLVSSALVACPLLLATACTPKGDPKLAASGFEDQFARTSLGDTWNDTGGNYRIVDGVLRVRGAHNRPLWLRRRLPHNVRIEFDARSESKAGDIKVEVFGDGVSKATTSSYTATSYVVIMGGWNNSRNVLARMDEHAADRVEGPPLKVVPGQTYHFKIERHAATLRVWVDDTKLFELEDPEPLTGPGHDHFAFNNWESEVYFDNLSITPL